MKKIKLAAVSDIADRTPTHFRIAGLDLVFVKKDELISLLYGRCLHRGALMGDGFVSGDNLICGLHGWDYRIDTGISEYNNEEKLPKFWCEEAEGAYWADEEEIECYVRDNPQPFDTETYQGLYADTHPENTEPYTAYIKNLAKNGLNSVGKHGPSVSMGVDRNTLPKWEDIQFLPAQLASKPLLDEESVNTEVIIGPKAKKPLRLSMPLFVSDMSFGALSKEAKIALSMGAELAGTGICSGEGGMLPEEKDANSHYLYELASGYFGFSYEKAASAQAFHFKGGQGAKTGTGGHLPGNKVSEEIAAVRGLKAHQSAISPATFAKLKTPSDFREIAEEVRERSGGIPIGFKLAASHIEKDIDYALEIGVDYIILDGRGGGTGSAPAILRDHINIPTIPALARARMHLNRQEANDVSLIITGGLRVAEDFSKALMLGADAVAIANSALQAIGCLGMRACGSNNCPVGIATQKENLRSRLIIEASAGQLHNFLDASNELIKVVARACGHNDIKLFNHDDLVTFNREMYHLTGITYAGIHA